MNNNINNSLNLNNINLYTQLPTPVRQRKVLFTVHGNGTVTTPNPQRNDIPNQICENIINSNEINQNANQENLNERSICVISNDRSEDNSEIANNTNNNININNENINREEQGGFRGTGTLVIDPLNYLGTGDNLDLQSVLTPNPQSRIEESETRVSHKKALELFFANFNKIPNREKKVRTPNRKYVEANDRKASFDQWRDAAEHVLPLSIIKNIESFKHDKTYIESKNKFCPTFYLFCKAESKVTGRKYNIEEGIIEFTVAPTGKPIHFFLRRINNRQENYLETQYTNESLQYHKNEKEKCNFPSLGVKNKASLFQNFNSDYLKIQLNKK